MKKCFLLLLVCSTTVGFAQKIDKIINAGQVAEIEKILSADDMAGRRTFTPGIEKASGFIETQFKKAGLKTFNGASNYRQEFFMYQCAAAEKKIMIDGEVISNDRIACLPAFAPTISLTQKDDISVVKINAGDKFGQKFYEYFQSKKNLLVLVDSSFSKRFANIQQFENTTAEQPSNTVIFVLGSTSANNFSINLTNTLSKKALNNVVGVLPGKSKPDEFVIFSAHYDHLGVGSPGEGAPHSGTDSIYNGANDDAAGTTAVIMLANYFKAMNNNERTIIFTTFTGEELGGFGSQYFSKQLDPAKVVAMFNIEMIGTDSKWGNNSAYITGFEKTDMGAILQRNLEGTDFHFYADPYPDQQLFYRSDNATLARLGVPAHTISTSKMDNEPNYHTAGDEMSTLNMENMAAIIKAIAVSSTSIISGKDTPSRVDATQLK
ncbi:M28 family metallopeptidase [Limnovirga soli]|uniref:M20/M25/M40 family metallo-hydrolase n=1 Tax=Limnovirga soli TaxID=2656915 RepID=A0A8J8FDV0_9BACT|nr:M28 family peptidase [Limnovirga soli]NNV56143.1 M20/M25/M40 family metallo-hydrolase [Limnovirga soli]